MIKREQGPSRDELKDGERKAPASRGWLSNICSFIRRTCCANRPKYIYTCAKPPECHGTNVANACGQNGGDAVLDGGRGIPVARPIPKNLKSAFRLNDAVLELIIA